MSNTPLVKKASGKTEPFSLIKLESSLKRAGASNNAISDIAKEIESWLYDGVSTKKIYAKAFDLLQKYRNSFAARYSLKNAIMDMGPTGYPFEHFVGQIFKSQGFDVEVGQIIQGQCVQHEVDVVATSNNKQFFVECKFYNSQGKFASVQVPLYIRSRVDDIIKKRQGIPKFDRFTFLGMVVTNTRFTSDAMEYGKCSGLHLLSWDYPKGHSLKDMIEKERFFPVTILTQLDKNEKEMLAKQGVVLCRQILEKPETLNSLGLKKSKFNSIMQEVEDLCNE